jgi:Flp pilus assembly protein CpaB
VKLTQRRLARPSIGGMMATRQGSLTLALLCAACAAGILMFALGHYKSGLHTVTPQATVLVASGEISKGTSWQTIASEGLYKSAPVVATQVSPGAISDAGQLVGDTAAVNILPGQQLTTNDFSTTVGVSGTLAPSERAVAISIDEAHGATDVLQAGDQVDIYANFTGDSTNGATSGSSGSGGTASAAGGTAGGTATTSSSASQQSILVLVDQNATVLKPASTTPVKSGGTIVAGGSLVLEIPASKVAQVMYAADNGGIYLSLRPPHATATPPYQITLSWLLASDPPTTAQTPPTTSAFTNAPSGNSSSATTTTKTKTKTTKGAQG